MINELDKLSHVGAKNVYKFLSYFNINCLKQRNNKLIGCCPIHGGDNRTAFNLWLENGRWKCRSHNCHLVFKSSFIGFVRGLLSKQSGMWSESQRDTSANVYNFSDTVNFIKNILSEVDIENIEYTPQKYNDEDFSNKEKYTDDINQYLDTHYVPCPFFSKKFSKKIVNKHLIGFCDNQNSNMYMRSVVPIFDINKKYIIGYTGRSINQECKKCGYFHNKGNCWDAPKWLHDFYAYGQLYNIWNIKEKQQKSIILTESIGNCLCIEQAGFDNVSALYGAYINKSRLKLLKSCDISHIIYIQDNRKAGLEIANIIKNEWSNHFNITIPDPIWDDDICELNQKEVTEYINKYV